MVCNMKLSYHIAKLIISPLNNQCTYWFNFGVDEFCKKFDQISRQKHVGKICIWKCDPYEHRVIIQRPKSGSALGCVTWIYLYGCMDSWFMPIIKQLEVSSCIAIKSISTAPPPNKDVH